MSARHKCLGWGWYFGEIREKGLCSLESGTAREKRKVQEAGCESDQNFSKNGNLEGKITMECKPQCDPKQLGDLSL